MAPYGKKSPKTRTQYAGCYMDMDITFSKLQSWVQMKIKQYVLLSCIIYIIATVTGGSTSRLRARHKQGRRHSHEEDCAFR